MTVLRRQNGQAAVELVALLPMVAIVAVAALTALASGGAQELAGHAAEAGAIAIVQGGRPREAARAAVPRWARDRLGVEVRGHRVSVSLRPKLVPPGLAELLVARSEAEAGP